MLKKKMDKNDSITLLDFNEKHHKYYLRKVLTEPYRYDRPDRECSYRYKCNYERETIKSYETGKVGVDLVTPHWNLDIKSLIFSYSFNWSYRFTINQTFSAFTQLYNNL